MATQYRVTWFPPNKPLERSAPTMVEATALETYEDMKSMGWAPYLEAREISEWDIIRNSISRDEQS